MTPAYAGAFPPGAGGNPKPGAPDPGAQPHQKKAPAAQPFRLSALNAPKSPFPSPGKW